MDDFDAYTTHKYEPYKAPQPQATHKAVNGMTRTWVGLTDDEIAVICGECAASAHRTDDISYARAIEAKLKEKNNG